jgi:uncharacterized transporter YbjL
LPAVHGADSRREPGRAASTCANSCSVTTPSNPAILAYSNKLAPTDRQDIGYAMIFPGMTIVKSLFADIIPVFFSG